MTFEITQQDLDICKLNGIDENSLNGFIADRQGWGLSDEEINARLQMLINDCKQTTPSFDTDTQNLEKWKKQPPISAFEYGKMNSYSVVDDTKDSLSFTPENPRSYSERIKSGFVPDDISANQFESLKNGAKYIADKINKLGEKTGKAIVYRNLNKEFYDPTGKNDKIGFWEATKNIAKQGTAIPFIGGYVSGAQKQIILDIDEKIKNGQKISADEAYAYECLLNKVKEERTRGYTNWGAIGESFLPSLLRFGGEIAMTGGALNAVGAISKAEKSASLGQKFISGVKNSVALGTGGAILNPSEVYDRYQNRTFENKMRLTPEGEIYFTDSLEKPATTFLKSMGDVFLSFACEGAGGAIGASGEAIGIGVSKLATKVTDPVLKQLTKNKNMRKLVEEVCPKILDAAQKKFSQADKFFDKTKFLADKVRFDGFLEEIGEEKLEDLLSLTFGLQNEKPSLENYIKIFNDPDDWAVLTGSVILQGATLSATSRLLSKVLKQQNIMSDEEINEAVNALPQSEQREILKNMVDDGMINPEIVTKVQSDEFWQDYKKQRYQQHIDKGLSDSQAKSASFFDSFMGAYFADYADMSDDEVADILPTFKSEDFRNKEQFAQKVARSRFIRDVKNNFKDYDTLSDYLSEINSNEYQNLSEDELYDFAVNREIQKYDAEHISQNPLDNPVEYVVDDEYNPKNILQGHVEYTENLDSDDTDNIVQNAQNADTVSDTDVSQENTQFKLNTEQINKLIEEVSSLQNGELIEPLLRALEGQADTNDVEQLKRAINHVSLPSDLTNLLNNQNGNVLFQPAMLQEINPQQKVDVVDLTSNFGVDKNLSKKDLSKYIQSLIGVSVSSADKKAILNFVTRSKRVGKDDVLIPDHIAGSSKVETVYKDERKSLVNNIIDLIEKSVLIEVAPNKDRKHKPNVDNYLRFYVPVQIGSDIYTVRIVAENSLKKDLFNIKSGNVYDVIIDKKMPTSSTSPVIQGNLMKSASDNIVANNSQNINPAQITIRDMLSNVEDADGNIYFQSATTAGAETSAEISDAQKEWQEKSIDSKYFKKWFGDSKVVDENGQPLVVYHGTESDKQFEIFETGKPDGTEAIYFSSDKKTANSYSVTLPVYEVYLKMENPLEVDAQGKEYNDFTAEMRSNLDWAIRNGHDGVIIKNIRDGWSQNKGGKVADTYVVFNPEQIKSVDNRGTFDESNPNIYYQSGYHGSAANYDKFDDDFIGSGEGAQVHGYGHYVAKDKNIADERYRERFISSRPMVEIDGDVYIRNDDYSWSSQDGQEYWDSDSYYGELLSVFYRTEDKNESIDIFQSELDELLEERNEVIEENNLNAELLELNDDDSYVHENASEYVDSLDEDVVQDLNRNIDRIITYKRAINVLKNNNINMFQGQLYQVEIPDDDVLLDEDNTIQEQSQKVISSLKELCRQEGFNYMKVVSGFDKEMKPQTGKQIYDNLRNYIQWQAENNDKAISDEISAKETSQLLNKYGIKGIKYNGNVDSECFVVFDPKNIEITRTFYQEGVNEENSSLKYSNFNDLVSDYSSTFEDAPADYGINVVSDALKDLGIDEKHPKSIETPVGKVLVTDKSISHIIDRDDDKTRYKSINKMFATLKNPTFVNVSENGGKYYYKIFKTSKETKNHTVVVRANELGEVVETTFPTRRDKNYFQNLQKYKTIYDVKEKGRKGNNKNDTAPVDSSITDNSSKSNPKRVGYVFKQPDDLQPNLFVNNASERLDSLDTNNEDNLYVEPRGPKGYRGRAVLDKNLILVTATGDVTTVVHEYAHWFLDMLENFEGSSDKLDDKLHEVRKYLKNDGSPFTREQHEKFAKSFENYIYRGAAKNSKLREIYEDIKNLLHEIYETIFKGEYFIGGDNPLSEQDLANANAVFDELFKLEHKNLQERVFKKIDDCNSIIADIKNNEKKEIACIYSIRDDIKKSIQQQGEVAKSVQQYKDAAEKYADKKENDKWKLYNLDRQNTAYSILSNALGIPSSEIKRKLHSKFPKTREKIELQLREVGDKLSAGDYFYDEKVIEYFGSIDMTDTDSSQQLVNMALDAIDTTVNLDSPLNRDINEFLNKFEYLKKQYAKTPQKNGKQLSIIIDVISDLYTELSASSLPSVFVSDFANEMKEITKDYADKLDNHSAKTSDNSYYGLVLHKLRNVKLYNAKEKRAVKISRLHDFYSKLPLAKNANGTEKLIREINNALIKDVEMRKKAIIAKEIAKQLRVNTRTIKTGSRVRKGLYDWKTNSTWLDMAKFNKMNMSELSAELENVITPEIKALYNLDDGMKEMTSAKENSSTVDFSFESKMKKKFIEYKLSGKLENANSALMLDLLSDIIEFKNKARKAKSEKELHDMLQRYDFRNNLAEKILNVSDKQKKLIKYFFDNNSLLNWNSILRVCFGEDAVQKYSIDNEESDKIIYENKILSNFYNKALKCYRLSKTKGLKKYLCDPNGIAQLQKMFRDYDKEIFSAEETIYDFKTKEAKTNIIKLNRSQIITMFTWYQNDLLRKRLINQFGGEYVGEKELEKLFDFLSDEDKQFAFLLMQTCDEMYDDVNEVMIRSQGLSLEKNENYFPSVVRRHGDSVDNVSLINCRIGQPSATKKRVKSQFVAMKPTNPLSILSRHIDMMSSYVCVSEKASFVSEIFGSPDLQRAFENAFDEQYSELIKKIGGYDSINPLSYKYINHTKNKDVKVGIKINPDLLERKNEKVKVLKIENNLILTNNRGDNKRTVKDHIFKNSPDKKITAVNVNTGNRVIINASSVDESLGKIKEISDTEKINIIADFKNIFENSELICSYRDVKSDIDLNSPERQKRIYRYAALVESGKNKYVCITTVKEAENNEKEVFLKAYNLESLDLKRNGIETMKPLYAESLHDTAKIIISDLVNIVNTRLVEKYNDDYKKAKNKFKEKNIDPKNLKLKKNKTTDGKQIWDYLSGQVAASTFFKYSQSVRTMTEKSKKWVNNWIVSSIALSPKIAFGQLLSCINYADGTDISFLDWTKGFVHCMAHPKETIEFMKQDEFLQARFKGNLQNETMQSILSEYDKWNNVKTFFTANIRIGDMFAIMFGGKPYIDHLMKQGVSKEEAFRRFRRKTNEAQQSTLPSTISNFQRTSQNSATSALLLAFTNTPHQYERKVIESIAELCRGQDVKTAMKNLVLYRFISPLLFEFLLQDLGFWLVLGAIGGDDDKGKIALISALNALMLGNYGAYALKGVLTAGVVNFACNMMSGKRMPFTTSSIPLVSDIERNIYTLMNDVKKGDLKTEHLISSLALLGGNATGVPFSKMINMTTGLGNALIDGDFAVGLHKALGWGDGVSRQAFE